MASYVAAAQTTYARLARAGGVGTLTRRSATALDAATDTVTSATTTVSTAGVVLPLPHDAAYALDALTRGRRVRVLLAAVDSVGAALAITPQAGDAWTLGGTTVTLASAPPLAPDGSTPVLYDCEGDR